MFRPQRGRAGLEKIISERRGSTLPARRIRTCAPRSKHLIVLAFMIHHIALYKLKPEVTPARVEAMMMNTRMQLLIIPDVLSINCGKRVDRELTWPFFRAWDFGAIDNYI